MHLNFSAFRGLVTTAPLLILLLMAGCSGKSFNYHPGTEIPEGPGVVSTDPEGFNLYDSKTGWFGSGKEGTPEGEQKSEKPMKSSASSPAEPASSSKAKPPATEDHREFQEFQEWKREKVEFEAFQEWKKSKQGSMEYEEFLEWKRWQEFKRWQEGQKKTN